jgi:transposase InsO family protein/transposase-like protein
MSIQRTVVELGYPSYGQLRLWANPDLKPLKKAYEPSQKKSKKIKPRVSCTIEEKLRAIHRCYSLGESASKVAQEMGLSSDSVIRSWQRKYQEKGYVTSMKKARDTTPPLNLIETPKANPETPDTYEALKAAYEALQAQNKAYLEERKQLVNEREQVAMERDVLAKTIELIKKDPGVNPEAMSNLEKVVIVDAMGDRYSRPTLFRHLCLSKSSYYYARAAIMVQDKYYDIRVRICTIFYESNSTYGYRRIWGELKNDGLCLSEKVVRWLMAEEELIVLRYKKRHYNSYKGELTPAPANLLKRDFHADKPNEKWLTDITEFHIPAGKVYLSPILDCYDGLIVSWSLGTSPNAELAYSSLKKATAKLTGETPIVHSDRGNHYRWPEWINLMTEHNLTRSMSKKGCSPDNSACEGFFGRLKNECLYNRKFAGVTTSEFIAYIDRYILWYNTKRIKKSLGYLSPVEYRRTKLLAA